MVNLQHWMSEVFRPAPPRGRPGLLVYLNLERSPHRNITRLKDAWQCLDCGLWCLGDLRSLDDIACEGVPGGGAQDGVRV